MAKETTIGYLPGNDPESAMANMAYQDALSKMQDALEARKNRFIDPEALSLAAGFLVFVAASTFWRVWLDGKFGSKK